MGDVFPGITIALPVGSHPDYKKYLSECLVSINSQMRINDEIILINDMAELTYSDYFGKGWLYWDDPMRKVHENPWLLGCAASWNIGVSLAKNDLVLLMGSDDVLLPECLDTLRQAYLEQNKMDAWYNLTIEITEGPDTGIHTVFNNAAAVTKGLWKLTGGFPPSGFAAPDALLISIMMVHMPERLIQVREGTPLYRARVHEAQDTPRQAGRFWEEVISIRNKETRDWKQPQWTNKA